ncbi:MAG: PKD domain-containing protein [Acidobacteria bacterium]|nr:PKD domain-containing protein [Acidobacteriota bacterium]MBV9476037.1 PKD domain-containing protein [Acidobacteriota bacterium]
MNRYLAYGLTCILAIVATAAHATTIVLPSDEQLIDKAPVIVAGTVASTLPVERNGRIWTDTVVNVTRTIKGATPRTITVSELGGVIDDRITKIFGAAEYHANENVLLFLEPSPHGGYRTMDLYVGKLTEGTMIDGRRLWMRDDAGADVSLLDTDLRPLHGKNVQREAAGFESFVAERVAGRAGNRAYGVENPALDRKTVSAMGRLQENFTLMTEGNVYRWFAFDNGGSAAWYSSGTQPGYTGGGVNETQTAMAAWTSYSSAKIRYTYAGTRSGPPGGLDASNGVNEVLFNDPLNDIAGSWNGSSGVVGLGGFTGVAFGGNWTAPFTADANHPAGTVHAYNLTEGDLTIQDNVQPSKGISSARLAEIIAHEFGHTLGIGHSADPTALMYPSVTGLGASLRADDQLAARWLYPNGNVSDPPPAVTLPAAPTSLTANAGSNYADLAWNDNANNETGESIYIAVGSGSFQKVGDVSANTTSARVNGLTSGTYRFYVVAFNTAGTSSPSNIATVTLSTTSTPLVASFTYSPSSGTAGITNFSFTDTSTGATSRTWTFGDGASATSATANHIYATAGTFTVTLSVSNGSASTTATQSVTVTNPLSANFNWSPANPTTDDTIVFSDESSSGVTSRLWSFGDGTNSTLPAPAHKYASPATYSVTLTVYRDSVPATITKPVTVAAGAPLTPSVQAGFTFAPQTISAGAPVTFTDTTSGAPTSWSWSFGDGATSSAQNPVHTFASAGTFTVSLTAANAAGSSTFSQFVTVTSLQVYRSLISVTAQTNGIGGTSWRTELTLFNAGTQGANVNLLFLPGAGGSVITRSVFLTPRQSVTYANTLLDLFGMPSGAGALAIEASSAGADAVLKVNSRTFTGGSVGTYGQSVPDVTPEELERTLYVTGMQSNVDYRTNFGLVNRGATQVSATLTLFDKNGTTVGATDVAVPPSNFQQAPLADFFPQLVGRSYDSLSMRITATASSALSAYASVIDNASQDPIYIQALPAPSGDALTIPVVGRTPGANGTFWRSDVAIFNPTNGRQTLTVTYAGAQKLLALNASSTLLLNDVLSLYGLTSGSGTLDIRWSSGTGPVVTSRTYTTATTGGTYGQSIDPVAAFAPAMTVPGLRNDGSFRTNAGFVNGGDETETFTVSLLAPSGNLIAQTLVGVDAHQLMQTSVAALFPGVPLSGNFTLAVEGDTNAKLFAYGSMVDNASGDPVFFAGR